MPFTDGHQGLVYATNRESPTKPLSTLSPKDMNEMERNAKNRGHSRAASTATAAIERSKLGQEEAEEKAKYYKSLLYNQVEKYEHQLEKYEDLQASLVLFGRYSNTLTSNRTYTSKPRKLMRIHKRHGRKRRDDYARRHSDVSR
jgi:hypothetical protein